MELMIVVAIVGVLAAIALPSYSRYVLRSNRSVAKSTLMDMASRQEAYFAERKQYSTTLVALGYAVDPTYVDNSGNLLAASSSSTVYSVAVSASPTTTFTLTATPVNNQTKDYTLNKCYSLTLNNTGTKNAFDSGGNPLSASQAATCWSR